MARAKNQKSLILLNDVREALKAEHILKKKEFDIKVVAPPPEVRIGCDLSIEVNLLDSFEAEKILRGYGIKPVKIVSLDNPQLKPTDMTEEVDFGDHLMVKAGHMKLTFNKKTGEIVNISGGGCPDIPFLALSMVGKTLMETKKPEDLGRTLCAYMLQKAYEKAEWTYRRNANYHRHNSN